MDQATIDAIDQKLDEVGAYLIDPKNVKRHPRSYQGPVRLKGKYVVYLVERLDNGEELVIEPLELEPGQGETPEPDVFMRPRTTLGAKPGAPLKDVLSRLIPAISGGGSGGLVELILGLFRRKK